MYSYFKPLKDPITSYGVICFRRNIHNGSLEYLMVQRHNSLNFNEFMRGKYNIRDKPYLVYMLSNMCAHERQQLRKTPFFDEIWNQIWHRMSTRQSQQYDRAKARFETLKRGIYNPCYGFYNLNMLLDEAKSTLDIPEWGFPKGRPRNRSETPFECAIREFREETGLYLDHTRPLFEDPYVEEFRGSNNVKYRHIYYVFDASDLRIGSDYDKREIAKVDWKTADQVNESIRDINLTRRELFASVDKDVIAKNHIS